MQKLVSIIVPVYNSFATIQYCLDSIRKQNYLNYEVLIIDDGSTDNSAKLIKSFIKKDNRFSYHYKDNGGVSSARNYGLDICNGEYICFIDSDDTITKDFISHSIDKMEKNKLDIYITSFNFVNKIDEEPNINRSVEKNTLLSKEDFLIALVNGNGVGAGCPNKIYKKKIIGKTRFTKVAVAEDLLFNYDVLNKSDNPKIMTTNLKMYNYFMNEDSVTHGVFTKQNLDIFKQYDKLIDDSQKEYNKFHKALLGSYVFVSIKILIKMVASGSFFLDVVNKCNNIINNNKKHVFFTKNYSFGKKLFLLLFIIFKNNIIKSYNKNNIWKKTCVFMNKKVG